MMHNFNLQYPCHTPSLKHPVYYWFCLPKTKRTISGTDYFLSYYSTIAPFKNNSPFKHLLLQNAKVNWILFLFSKELSTWRNVGVTEQRQPWDSEFQYKLCQWLLDGPEKWLHSPLQGRVMIRRRCWCFLRLHGTLLPLQSIFCDTHLFCDTHISEQKKIPT